ncbi:carbon-nitrogen hydrolase family protein [Pectobacterium versatile]|jgi:predicted amidohydrolase|uniref:carbon-nitrogen hydrolase family protein n=1 Tax=Pectobacterium versatile TaxID=2488639 RepID=UPI000FAFEC3B|nr:MULTISPECIES: carbon-nitrogen hydrolase family protein [Pectobacterium]MBA0164680.1 carbon-nitrogen hydrolase family protein [Pectobacterium versatile]MBA0169838.1 carbon-nitrogen hydrolase family protein [Pectobacterium versatile]MBD0847834.1 acyltransferase [Pectobacterium carotovorum subsp. carotovorum]MBK4826218.1 NAD(+) synthase (glutamine-hydrolyzing) [Pectobacterium carotovorum subsp. carotovorum]MBN3059886.1 carbon-nitrogen hydrolase family protein [Pectobacterium versatile]
MKICIAQIASVAGHVDENVKKHQDMVITASQNAVDMIVFPELSLSGYEPSLAEILALPSEEIKFDVFQSMSDEYGISIAVGYPVKFSDGIKITMIIFQPEKETLFYSKQLLHPDEMPFFKQGKQQITLSVEGKVVVPAICYESLQPAHALEAEKLGADLYAASVAKSANGVVQAYAHYPVIARKHGMFVLMANAVGKADNFICAGQSAVWDREGKLLIQANATQEALLILDTETGKVMMIEKDHLS